MCQSVVFWVTYKQKKLIVVYLDYLWHSLSLGDKLISDLHSGIAQSLQHVSRVQTQQVCNLVSIWK